MERLDIYEVKPDGMAEYLSNYGWHFSKSMCKWAVSMMRDCKDMPVEFMEREKVDELVKKFGMSVESKGYDAVYAYAMLKADFFGSSVVSEQQMVKMMCDIFNDKDGYDGMIFTRWYADMIAKGVPIIWGDMM